MTRTALDLHSRSHFPKSNLEILFITVWPMQHLSAVLLFVVAIPLVRRQYKARKVRHGFQLYMKKKLGVVLNLLTSDKFEYKQPTRGQPTEDLQLTFDKFILQFEQDLQKNKEKNHALFAFEVLVNLQPLLMTVPAFKVYSRQSTSHTKYIHHCPICAALLNCVSKNMYVTLWAYNTARCMCNVDRNWPDQ